MSSVQQEIDERTKLTSSNKFEMLLFRLGGDASGERSELFGINVFKIREIVAMPPVTAMAGAPPHVMGVVNLRGQIIPVIDLSAVTGNIPKTGHNIMLVTEYARTTQAFAVEGVEEIVRLDWKQVLSAENSAAGGMVTSIARLDDDVNGQRLVQVLDVESILRRVMPTSDGEMTPENVGPQVKLKEGTMIVAADDSFVARALIEQGLQAMNLPYVMCKTGQEAWEKLQSISAECAAQGRDIHDKVALVLTDLEMPEMDGFTLTRMVKQDPKMRALPVVIHSSLSGATNEDHVRTVGADAYVPKFVAEDLAGTLRRVLAEYGQVV